MDFVIFVINFVFSTLYILLAIRAIVPWIPNGVNLPLLRPIYLICEPLVAPIKLGLPPDKIGFDVAPFVLIILLWLVQQLLLRGLL